MPPHLAFHMLKSSSVPPNVSRTPWDEMCSIFLCFISTVLDERRGPDAPALYRDATLGQLASRMSQLLEDTEHYCARNLRPLYKENSVLVSHIQQAIGILFPNNSWITPPPDAGSMEWWNKMHNILDLLAS
jgi:hypothetical protein